jgi:hypothetical protein
MARRRSRFIEKRRNARSSASGPDPASAMRLAVFGALVLVMIAVAAGFQGERFAAGLVRALSFLGPLAEPVLFGASWLEIGAVGLGLAVLLVMGARALRR